MTRLDSAIRRLEAQRACLDTAADLIRALPGPVLEIGLGNGRTYDHLRSILPDRVIYVFDRCVAAHPDCVPPEDRLFVGDILETLPAALRLLGARAALAHVDIGNGDAAATRALAGRLAAPLAAIMASGGTVVSDQPIPVRCWRVRDLPEGVRDGRYHMYLCG